MEATGLLIFCSVITAPCVHAQQATNDSNAVAQANRPFTAPEMMKPTIDEKVFAFTDVGAKIPNYTPGRQWGAQGAPLTEMQNPLPAEMSIKAYSVPQSFSMSLWAKELNSNWPEQSQRDNQLAGLQGKPIAMNWDERGRLWICETIDYPNELQPVGKGRDRIKICEDTDNDGRADKFTVFAEHLSIPSTLVCYRGGVIVQDGQSTIYLKDIDGDDRADFRQVLITGWAMGDTHGGVSNFQYGPDNWIWGMQGYNNSSPVINGQKQMSFRQGFWRFKVKAGAADETAPAFAIDKSTPKRLRRLHLALTHTPFAWPHWSLYARLTITLGDSVSAKKAMSSARPPITAPAFTCPFPIAITIESLAGHRRPSRRSRPTPSSSRWMTRSDKSMCMVDTRQPLARRSTLLEIIRVHGGNRIQMVCEPTGHLVGSFVLEKHGAGYKSNNTFNTVASIDDWAAPIMAEVGPDGNVWVLDWYNYIIQHNPTPNGFKTGKGAAYESDLRDKRFARIYRLMYQTSEADKSQSHTRDLAKASNTELVDALKDKNFFWRRTAQRLLVEREAKDASVLTALVALVDNQQTDEIGLNTAAMHAIWTLAGLAESGDKSAEQALASACGKGFQHPSSPVRNAAIGYCQADQVKQALELNLRTDADPRVRLTLLLRIADNAAAKPVAGQLISGFLLGQASTTDDDILLDAWTAAAATNQWKHCSPSSTAKLLQPMHA